MAPNEKHSGSLDTWTVDHASFPRTTHREILKNTAAGLLVGGMASMTSHASRAQISAAKPRKILIVYFSRTGNTRVVAEHLLGRVGGDLVEIRATHAYPADYRETTEQARREQDTHFRPDLASDVADTAPYDTVFIGYPNWWGTLPMALFTFLDRHDLSGKTIVPFCTHEGSSLGRGPGDIRAHCPAATVLAGLALRGGSGGYARGDAAGREIDAWVRRLSLTLA